MLARQIKFYLLCGAVSTSFDLLIYFSLVKLGSNIDLSKAFSFMAATGVSYFLNKKFTFQCKRNSLSQAVNFYLAHGVAMLVDVACNRLFLASLQVVSIMHQRLIAAFVLATACSVVVNFISQKYWVFKK